MSRLEVDMGGNIKFNTITRRCNKTEYNEIQNIIDSKLRDAGIRHLFIMSYYSKESFGDVDVLIDTSSLFENWVSKLCDLFELSGGNWKKDGNLFSFVLNEVQVDFILTPYEDMISSFTYFAWNDLSNLIGRISHKWGIKYGHDGAWVVVRDGDYLIGKVLVDKNLQSVIQLLDLNLDVYNRGFNTMEDAYSWLVKSKYFNKDIFKLENRNHTARTRDKKRINYTNFLKWIDEQPENSIPHYPYSDVTSKDGYNIREPFYTLICDVYPHVREQVDKLKSGLDERRNFKLKYNGELVMYLTGLTGIELGNFMRTLDKEKIKTLTTQEIQQYVKDMYDSRTK